MLDVAILNSSYTSHRLVCLLFVAAFGLGCQGTRYRAASLPMDLRAQTVEGAGRIHLPNLAATGQRSTAVGPGDKLDVWVVSGLEEAPPKPQVVRVAESGEVDIPLIGPVAVAGLEPDQASRAIGMAAVERGVYRRPNVTLEISERATHKVTVLGAVEEPGVHELPVGECNVLAALAAAGGLTTEAGTEIEVMRQPSPTRFASQETPGDIQQVSFEPPPAPMTTGPRMERIDLAQAATQPTLAQQLGDRDVVMIPPRTKRVIHVSGLVQKPDQFELPPDHDVRLLDAIAMAGGRSSPVADRVFVVRQRDEGQEPAVIQVSIAKAKQVGNENLVLAPGDLVSVESTVATTAVDVVKGFFRVSLGLTSAALSF